MQSIRIYGRENCIWCSRAKQLVETRSYDHRYLDVIEAPAERSYVEARLGRTDFTLPQIFVGETLIGGFTQLAAADKSGQLQQLIGGH